MAWHSAICCACTALSGSRAQQAGAAASWDCCGCGWWWWWFVLTREWLCWQDSQICVLKPLMLQAAVVQLSCMAYEFLLLQRCNVAHMRMFSVFLALPSATVRAIAANAIVILACKPEAAMRCAPYNYTPNAGWGQCLAAQIQD